jgi:sarcosine oxidase / L-pipecolate oxidase
MKREHPIIIVGAETFGLSTALSLSKSYQNITIFDRFNPPVRDAASTDINKVIRADYGTDLIIKKWI